MTEEFKRKGMWRVGMIRWSNIIAPLIAAAIAARFISVQFWDASKQGLLVALSVIAAGVLVRLARGLPFTTADHYELDEIRHLTRAVSQVLRSLRLLIIVVLAGMIGLIFAKPILELSLTVAQLGPYEDYVEAAISGTLGLILCYVLFRMLQVVRGDQDLTELQSSFIVRAVERRQAKNFEAQHTTGSPSSFKPPAGYGRVVR